LFFTEGPAGHNASNTLSWFNVVFAARLGQSRGWHLAALELGAAFDLLCSSGSVAFSGFEKTWNLNLNVITIYRIKLNIN